VGARARRHRLRDPARHLHHAQSVFRSGRSQGARSVGRQRGGDLSHTSPPGRACRPVAAALRTQALFAFGPLVLLGFLTVGSVASGAAGALLRALPIDVTFTGRTETWSFALDSLRAHPWKGYGFEAFWYSAAVRFGAEDSTRWMVEAATSHNSYVDLALTIGIPGLALVVLAFVVAPLRDFHRTHVTPENVELSRFFLVLWLFALYLGTFEAFFLSRATPMWFILALAVCGLRYTSQLAAKD
jgi:O-antigen ligase